MLTFPQKIAIALLLPFLLMTVQYKENCSYLQYLLSMHTELTFGTLALILVIMTARKMRSYCHNRFMIKRAEAGKGKKKLLPGRNQDMLSRLAALQKQNIIITLGGIVAVAFVYYLTIKQIGPVYAQFCN